MPGDRGGAVAGIVLAAGTSSRMGRNKLFFTLDGVTLLRRAVSRAVDARLDPIIVVLGHEADRARAELVGLPCRAVTNLDYQLGINRSLRTGINAVAEDSQAAIVMLADMPLVTTDMLSRLVERYRAGTAPLVISDYGGVTAPPMLYDRGIFPELQSMEGEGCGKQVVKRHRGEATVVTWPPDALTDLDEPLDYERMKTRLAAG